MIIAGIVDRVFFLQQRMSHSHSQHNNYVSGSTSHAGPSLLSFHFSSSGVNPRDSIARGKAASFSSTVDFSIRYSRNRKDSLKRLRCKRELRQPLNPLHQFWGIDI